MDVLYFLGERTDFVRYFFGEAVKPFEETIRRIKAEEAPYEPPPWDDSMPAEPPFQDEYNNAQRGLNVVGQTCLSMLSESLKAFFLAHEHQLGVSFEAQLGEEAFKKIFSKGFIRGYRICFERFFRVDWTNCPADLEVLEQIVLARNDSQHTGPITQTRATHSPKSVKRFPDLLFVNECERTRLASGENDWLIEPTVFASKEQLQRAIDEVAKLAAWFESDDCVADGVAGTN